jgi:CotS family spore coat protein
MTGGIAMQGIEKEIESSYSLTVSNLFPYKDTFIAVTSKGRKVIRRVPFSFERLKFVHGAKEHLAVNGFPFIDPYLLTKSGEPGFYLNNSLYALTDLIDGRESSFDSDADLVKAAAALAHLHEASCGYIAPIGCKVQNELGRLPGYFAKRLDDIKKMRNQARKGKGRFDQLFLQYADRFIAAGEEAVLELASSAYDKLSVFTWERKSFCHHDYTHHNIIINSERVNIINFDYCCYELRVYDIANLIRRKMRKCDWDISKAGLIIDSYSSVEPLSREELEVMKIILKFPQKLWRVANRYYNSRRSWSEKSYMSRLQEVIDEMEPFGAFIKAFEEIYL